MRKVLFIFAVVVLCTGCFHSQQEKASGEKDSIVTIFGSGGNIELPLDSFLIVKDSFVYCKEEGLWMTKELYRWNYEFPDTIVIPITKKGKVVDSIKAGRYGLLEDIDYSPGYAVFGIKGIYWYDVNGKFIKYVEQVF